MLTEVDFTEGLKEIFIAYLRNKWECEKFMVYDKYKYALTKLQNDVSGRYYYKHVFINNIFNSFYAGNILFAIQDGQKALNDFLESKIGIDAGVAYDITFEAFKQAGLYLEFFIL